MFNINNMPTSACRPIETATLDFVAALESIDNFDGVALAFQSFVEDLGFSSAVCIALPEAGALPVDSILMNTRPDEFSREYIARGCLRADPMIRELVRTLHPFAWSDVTGRRKMRAHERDVMRLAEDFDMDCGFVVPILDSSGNIGLMSIAGKGAQLNEMLRCALALASTYVHNRLCILKRMTREDDVRLTARELECLKWIAAGKSDWQTGQILNISAKTVNYHVENVKRKFCVATRIQAVVAAMRQGSLAR